VGQEFAYQVAVGQKARIEDDVPSGMTWTGKVLRMADWFAQRRNLSDEPMQARDVRTVECLVTVDPGQAPLRIGQRVRVFLGGSAP
jgi:hypothetical protein